MLKKIFKGRVRILLGVLFGLVALSSFTSCDKFLDIKPAGVVMPSTTSDYRALLTRAYHGHPTDLAKLSMRSDEAAVNFTDGDNATARASYEEIFTWEANVSLSTLTPQWQGYYSNIYVANHLISHVASGEGSSAEDRQLIGEAYLMRAYTYFLLANLYGQPYSEANRTTPCVPLMLDNEIETIRVKSSLGEVYEQIKKDVQVSMDYLTVEKQDAAHRYRFGKDAARAFACRVALYTGNWNEAIAQGTQLLLSGRYALADLNEASAKLPCHYESSESIMNLDLVMQGDCLLIMRASSQLIGSYEQGDQRKSIYFYTPTIGDYRVQRGDVKKGEERAYRITFRLGEVLLNVAEAYAHVGALAESKELLKQLAKKRFNASGLSEAESKIDALSTDDDLLDFLLAERGRELAFEGLRWFDLRRFGCPALEHELAGKVYTLAENDPRYTLPIPREAKESNSNL